MAYAFPSMEKGTPSGNAAETCAILHLMCYSKERDDIESFAIDCFNDVTGMDGSCFSLYDAQSKAGKVLIRQKSAKALQRYLRTLLASSRPIS